MEEEEQGPPPPRILTTISHLEWLAERLHGEPRLAIDVESDGFFAYREKVCLIQISSEKEDFIVDPLAAKDLSPLSRFMSDREVEKVFHASEYDILCLKRDFGFRIHGIFDTMVASRILGEPKLGLAHLIGKHFGVHLSKKLQRANWGKRPLSPEHLEYARMDTHYLLRLRDILERELEGRKLLKEAREAFGRLELLEHQPREFDPQCFWRLQGAKELSPQARAVLKEIYLYRERKSADLNLAPFRVLPEPLLVKLAALAPISYEDLGKARGMTPYLYEHYGKELIEAMERGLCAQPEEEPPARPSNGDRWDGATTRRYESLRQWRKEQAEKRGVNPVVILDTDEVKFLAEAPSRSGDQATWLCCLSEYKKELYGPELTAILSVQPPPRAKRRRRKSKTAPAV
ncbi:MAG: HRDC domain-containing protein [Elusimicrobiota bacterium]